MMRRAARLVGSAVFACVSASACHSSVIGPASGLLAPGRWTGDGACLSVSETECNLVVGCGHGQFPPPAIRADGTFEVDGTYRIEVGPISVQPAPPAHFSGSVNGSRLILSVVPAGPLPPATYSMTATSAGICSVPCV